MQDIKSKAIDIKIDKPATLVAWKRNFNVYFSNGKSIRGLLNKDSFENEKALSEFIKTHLLTRVENEALKDYYQSLILYSSHHGGFPHAFSKIS